MLKEYKQNRDAYKPVKLWWLYVYLPQCHNAKYALYVYFFAGQLPKNQLDGVGIRIPLVHVIHWEIEK